MKCVSGLTVQFFIANSMLFLGMEPPKVTQLMENAKATIGFCPMLAILFVGTRMRALMITKNKGAPQGWVQDGMYMATWAVLVQFLTVLVVGVSTQSDVKLDEDGTPIWEPSMQILKWVALGLKWITFIFLYGGMITVVGGVHDDT